jgi:phosphoenolpyruvate carboxylase
MSTQHPDNATAPFFGDQVIEGEAEIREAYYAYSHLGADEQMWDFEGKEGDEYAVKKLLSRYDGFFANRPLGDDVRLTVRGPNPDVEENEGKVLLEILESIPRSYDAADAFATDLGIDTVAPIHEVIVPMVTDAGQVGAVRDYYEQYVAGKADATVGGRRIADWVGEFDPPTVSVIPLIETREAMLSAHDITREYVAGRDIESQRVFLARSDPALNYGSLSADLINLVALKRLHRTAGELDIEVHPILGAGSAPFRGGLAPDTVEETLDAYPGVTTFTVQSAFKYDYPVDEVRDAIGTLRTAPLTDPRAVDEERALDLVDRFAETYTDRVEALAPLVNRVAEHVPKRRARKLHVGLFGYSREVGENALPRAIGYTAALYSIGLPPSLLGVSALTDADIGFVKATFPRFFETLGEALRYHNPRAFEVADITDDDVEAAADLVDADPDPAHRAATDDVLDALQAGRAEGIEDPVVRAARERGFLG